MTTDEYWRVVARGLTSCVNKTYSGAGARPSPSQESHAIMLMPFSSITSTGSKAFSELSQEQGTAVDSAGEAAT